MAHTFIFRLVKAMKQILNFLTAALCITAVSPQYLSARSELRQVESATQLMVDGHPFIIAGGEVGNSMASSPHDVGICISLAKAHGYNTVLMPMTWEMIEPERGKFDFSSVDTIIATATREKIRVVPLWFGAWKNSMSCYAPSWFKTDTKRYPRARTAAGKPLEIASAFSPEVYNADASAFKALMEHIAATDTAGTVIMVQIENEIGMLENARDHSPLAEKEYAKGVPPELMKHLDKNRKSLHPRLLDKWKAAGMKKSGSWTDVFGDDIYTDELFMAWNYAVYVEGLARIARSIFPTMPLYVNAAMNSRGRQPGEYPSAGPLAHLKDVWHAGAPTLDFLSPDLYDSGFTGWVAAYALPDNPLFIPEIKCTDANAAQLYYTVSEHDAIGLCPFAFNNREGGCGNGPRTGYQKKGVENLLSLTPFIASAQGKDLMNGFYFDSDSSERILYRDGLRISARHYFTLPWDPRATNGTAWPVTGGLIIRTAPMEYIIAGSGIVLTFEPADSNSETGRKLGEDGFLTAGSDRTATTDNAWKGKRIGLAAVEEVEVASDGSLTRIRIYNGDETHQGRHVRIGVDDYQILHVKLYEYE